MVKAHKYVVKKYFEGLPKKDDFEIVEYELPPLKNGEFMVKAEWISVDPYLRAYNRSYTVPYDQFGYQVGVVKESKNPEFPVGANVVNFRGWSDYNIFDGNNSGDLQKLPYLLPDLKGLSSSLGVGAIGMPGVTAYFGYLEVLKPKAGDTVVVSGAAGAVGSILGQIAKIKGCRVIGIAGSDEKVQWLEKDLGFDKAINYKTADLDKALKEAAPKGVDRYFDNVGGDISYTVMSQMNEYGRVAVCGSISVYNEDPKNVPKSAVVQALFVFRQLTVEGFMVWKWLGRWHEAFPSLIEWIKDGKIKAREHVVEGFHNLVDAQVGMMKGDNFGKAVVKV